MNRTAKVDYKLSKTKKEKNEQSNISILDSMDLNKIRESM